MPKIIAKIDAIGNVVLDAQDFQGVGCAEATGNLEKVLAGTAVNKEIKPEYYEAGATEGQTLGDRL